MVGSQTAWCHGNVGKCSRWNMYTTLGKRFADLQENRGRQSAQNFPIMFSQEIINVHVFTSDSQSVNFDTEMHFYLCNNSSEYCHFCTFLLNTVTSLRSHIKVARCVINLTGPTSNTTIVTAKGTIFIQLRSHWISIANC